MYHLKTNILTLKINMKTRSDFTFKPIDNVSLLQRLCMGFNVSFGLNQMSQYIDDNGNPTQKAIDLFAKNITHAHKSPLFLEHIPTFTSLINIGEKESGPEGFVANGLKVVNRTEFSKANREKNAQLRAKK